MCAFPQIQEKLRNEVMSNISELFNNFSLENCYVVLQIFVQTLGDRIPQLEDKENCHYMNAFICEVLRLRPPFPMGSMHKCCKDSEIGNS